MHGCIMACSHLPAVAVLSPFTLSKALLLSSLIKMYESEWLWIGGLSSMSTTHELCCLRRVLLGGMLSKPGMLLN